MLFNRKFAAQAIAYRAKVGAVVASNIPLLRNQGLLRYAADVLYWFEQNPNLTSVKLLAVVTPDVSVTRTVDVRLRHHVKVTGIGGQLFGDDRGHDDYVMLNLPYQCLGAGVFEVARADALVQEYLSFSGSEDERFAAIVHVLADRMHNAISEVHVTHEFGLASAL